MQRSVVTTEEYERSGARRRLESLNLGDEKRMITRRVNRADPTDEAREGAFDDRQAFLGQLMGNVFEELMQITVATGKSVRPVTMLFAENADRESTFTFE